MRPYTAAIIVAAGNSTRMGLAVSKQFIELLGQPVIFHTISVFESSSLIDEIVVVAKASDKKKIDEIARGFSKVSAVVEGGESRKESVSLGVRACSKKTAFFAIHDGARPLITLDKISDVVTAAYRKNAATLATRVTDTVKIVGEDRVIRSTPDRASLFAVQTPQVFARPLYERAMGYAFKNDLTVTDDCSMVERLGEPVTIVEGSYSNIKLTTQDDLLIAEAILKKRKKEIS